MAPPSLGQRGHPRKKQTRCNSPLLVLFAIILGSLQLLLLRAANRRDDASPPSAAGAAMGTTECTSQLRPFLTAQEREASLDALLCGASASLAALVMSDRSELRTLRRREYLRDLRSYRLAGLVCNDHLDKELPPVASEAAFRCLPYEYKRRACMDGRVEAPGPACGAYKRLDPSGGAAPYVPEPERGNAAAAGAGGGIQAGDDNYPEECKRSAAEGIARCHESAMGIKGGSVVSPTQLAAGVPEARVLTSAGGKRYVWRREALDFHLRLIREGKDVSPLDYAGSHKALQRALEVAGVRDKAVAIFGSISPWVESIVHHNGAQSPVVTVDYNPPVSYDDRIVTESMGAMLEKEAQFDVVVSYSSIEHDGQGRYNDPLDPDGDLAAMKECWLKVAPGGWFLLHVPLGPFGQEIFAWYSQRLYGAARLPLLIRGWEYRGLATTKKVFGPEDEFSISEVEKESPVLLLRKPRPVGVHDVLDVTKFGGLHCDVKSKMCRLAGKT